MPGAGDASRSPGVCRVCLATDMRMLPIGDALQPVYEKLAGTELHNALRPVVACYICHALLLKARRLMQRAITSENALKVILNIYSVVTESSVAPLDRRAAGLQNSLTISKLEYLDNLKQTNGEREPERSNHANGELEESDGSNDEGSVPVVDVSDVESDVDVGQADEQADVQADDQVDDRADSTHDEEDVEEQTKEDEQIKRGHKCSVCARSFKKPWLLRLHLKAHNAPRPAQCRFCNRYFKRPWNLKRHILMCVRERYEKAQRETSRNTGSDLKSDNGYKCDVETPRNTGSDLESDKGYKCDVCLEKFVRREVFEHHMLVIHKLNPYKCPYCEKKFSTIFGLSGHKRSHKDKIHKCKICQYRSLTRQLLEQHMQTHIRSFKCHICRREFSFKTALDFHLAKHATRKPHPYKCRLCSQTFARRDRLAEHNLRNHEAKHQCKICLHRFESKEALISHLRNHAGKFKCRHCQYQTNYSSNLTVHLRTHSGEKPFQCDVCYLRLTSKQSLRNHSKIHGEKHMCSSCNRRFPTNEALRSHMEAHEPEEEAPRSPDAAAPGDKIRCSLCKMTFSLKIAFRRHVIAEHL